MNKTSISSDTSPNPDSGVTDSPWQPSWWQWLISALSGTLEIERQIAWLQKNNEEMRIQHELRMSELRRETEQVRKENERLAVFDCVTLRERIQNRWIILQVQYQLAPREQTQTALADFVVFLQEYGE
jgi:hypothetical protein